MTDVPDAPLAPPLTALEALKARADELGIPAQLKVGDVGAEDFDEGYFGTVSLSLRNGRDVRVFDADAEDAEFLIGEPLDRLTYLDDYAAISDQDTGEIEARVVPSGNTTASLLRPANLWRLPGVEILDKKPETEDGDAADESPSAPTNWRLRLEREGKVLELSPASRRARVLLSMYGRYAVTLKLQGFEGARHDDAVRELETWAGALFFDLDLLYNRPLTIMRRRRPVSGRVREKSKLPPVFPKNHYALEPLALYQYGRSAGGLPLLEFLAYYQAMEYFFPSFAHEETTNALRTTLMNPRFDPSNDEAIARLITMAAPAVKAGIGEREQLRATVRSAATAGEIRAYIEGSGDKDHFVSKKQAVKGVPALHLDTSDLREQIAERIYVIRCRIVHTKQDGGRGDDDLLLPTSPEAASLGPEISLLRYLTQQALVARARRSP